MCSNDLQMVCVYFKCCIVKHLAFFWMRYNTKLESNFSLQKPCMIKVYHKWLESKHFMLYAIHSPKEPFWLYLPSNGRLVVQWLFIFSHVLIKHCLHPFFSLYRCTMWVTFSFLWLCPLFLEKTGQLLISYKVIVSWFGLRYI